MNDNQVLLAIPTRGTINFNTVRRILELQEKHPEMLIHLEAGNLGVSHVRNAIVQQFLKSECESLLQIDDDVIPPLNILEMAKSVTPERPVIAGPYHIVRPEMPVPFPCVFTLREPTNGIRPFKPIENPWREGLVECDGVGTGCMAIHRSLLEREDMQAPFLMFYTEQGTMLTSDDLAFCSRVRSLGVPISADYRYPCDHMVTVSMQITERGYSKAYTLARKKEKPLVTLA